MTKPEFIKAMTYLGTMYGKSYDENDISLQYEFYKDLEYQLFIRAIKNHIKTSSFEPKVKDLLDSYEVVKREKGNVILLRMKERGYFKDVREYDKATVWLERGIIPEWFRKDMMEYQDDTLLTNKTNNQLLIENK